MPPNFGQWESGLKAGFVHEREKMKFSKHFKVQFMLAPIVAATISACGTTPVNVAPMPPAKYKNLGHVEGQGCGGLGFFGTITTFVPMGNGRWQSAYDNALSKAPGATGLVNVEIKEDWTWVIFATLRCTTLSGDAIKEIK